jgi:hypothetical protein
MPAKKIGAATAWMIKALFSDVTAIPIPIVAAQSTQPIKAWARMMVILKAFIVLTPDDIFHTINIYEILPLGYQERSADWIFSLPAKSAIVRASLLAPEPALAASLGCHRHNGTFATYFGSHLRPIVEEDAYVLYN